MKVEVVFPTGERIEWGFQAVPRQGDHLDFSDPSSPRSHVLVERVEWNVTERGCGTVTVYVR